MFKYIRASPCFFTPKRSHSPKPDAPLTAEDLPFALRPRRKIEKDTESPTEFLQREIDEYNAGKRWLAQMMGADPETFTQDDIDAAIEYLMPTHIFAKDARPKMTDPREMYAEILSYASKVDKVTGRPYEAGFYTGQPGFYNATYEIWQAIERVNDAVKVKEESALDHEEGPREEKVWMSKMQLEQQMNERITDKQYEELLNRLKRLDSNPHVSLIRPILEKFRAPVTIGSSTTSVLEHVEICGGEARAQGQRKTSIAEVFVREGSGKITINQKHLNQFFIVDSALQQVAYPLLVTGDQFAFDIEGYVMGGGFSGQAGALRLAISRAIAGLRPEHQQALEDAGLLRVDTRRKERKKPGRRRAREKYAWRRR